MPLRESVLSFACMFLAFGLLVPAVVCLSLYFGVAVHDWVNGDF